MSREEKYEILDFVNFYVTLGIIRLSAMCDYIGVSARTIQRWNKYGLDDKRTIIEKEGPQKLTDEQRNEVFRVACSDDYKDMNPHEIYDRVQTCSQFENYIEKTSLSSGFLLQTSPNI